jgi:hypothetical protein
VDYARSPHSPVVNVALIDELERSREEEAERARRARMAEITRSAGEATAVATAAAAVAGATAVASAVRRQLQQRRDLPRAPSQTPFYPDPSPAAPRRTTRSVNTEIVVEHRATPSAMSPPSAMAGPTASSSSSFADPPTPPEREPDPPSFHPSGFAPDRRDAEATVMQTAIKLEKERRKLREEREIFQKRQWDLDARELGLKQREARCAKAVELYQMREDARGEHISASNAALLRESEDARRDLEGLKSAAIEAEERARRAEARLRMIEEDADRKRDELESLRAKARARAANDARRMEQEPEWERASLARNRETKLRELLAETFGVVGDVNRALEHGFARCGALAEGLLARVGAMADATEDGAPGGGERELGRLRGIARELRADGARFEAAWSELRKAYLRGRREVDRHAATIEMESGMSLD